MADNLTAAQYIPPLIGIDSTGDSITATPLFNEENPDNRSGLEKVKDFYTNYWSAIGSVFFGDIDSAKAYGKAAISGDVPPTKTYSTAATSKNNDASSSNKAGEVVSNKLLVVLGVGLVIIWTLRR